MPPSTDASRVLQAYGRGIPLRERLPRIGGVVDSVFHSPEMSRLLVDYVKDLGFSRGFSSSGVCFSTDGIPSLVITGSL